MSDIGRVSVILLCHNQLQNLGQIVRALTHQTAPPFEVIVADDGSSEPIESAAARFGCRYVNSRSEYPGIGGYRSLARQLGTNAAQGGLLLYLDGDMIPSRRLVELMLQVQTTHRFESVIQGTRINDRRIIPDATKANEDRLSFGHFTSDCFSIARDIARSIGGWDPNFTGWGEEDVEFAFRCEKAGVDLQAPLHLGLSCVHIDHPVNHEANFASLRRNAKYFTLKYPEIGNLRRELWESMGVYLRHYRRYSPGKPDKSDIDKSLKRLVNHA